MFRDLVNDPHVLFRDALSFRCALIPFKMSSSYTGSTRCPQCDRQIVVTVVERLPEGPAGPLPYWRGYKFICTRYSILGLSYDNIHEAAANFRENPRKY